MSFNEDYGPNRGLVVLGNRNAFPGRGLILNGDDYEWTTDFELEPWNTPAPHIPGAVAIRIRNTYGTLVDLDDPGSYRRALMPGSKFTFNEAGAASATLQFSDKRFADIPVRTPIDIHLDNSRHPCWTGYIDAKPIVGDTGDTVTLNCLGIASQLKWGCVILRVGDEALPVWRLVDMVARDLARFWTDVIYEPQLIDEAATYPVSQLSIVAASYDETFAQLATLAGDYQYGIDESNRFYFRKRPKYFAHVDEASIWWQGYDFADYTGETSLNGIKNIAFVKHPTATEENFGVLPEPLMDYPSMANFGDRSMTISAPSSLDPVDAYRFASVELMAQSQPRTTRKLSSILYTGQRPSIPGRARIWTPKPDSDVSINSRWDKLELWKREITYTIHPSHLEMDITLDSLPKNLVGLVNELNTMQARQELMDRTKASG